MTNVPPEELVPDRVGRGGIIIPEVFYEKGDLYSSFFRNFFRANGKSLDERLVANVDFWEELIVPSSDSKPTVVVRAAFDTTAAGEESPANDGFGYNEWKLTAKEVYQVLVEPQFAGDFDKYMEVERDHLTGSGSYYPGGDIVRLGSQEIKLQGSDIERLDQLRAQVEELTELLS